MDAGNRMTMHIPLGNTGEQHLGRGIDWTALLIVIAAIPLVSLSIAYGTSNFFGSSGYEVESKTSLVLSFVAATIFLATIALVVYSREYEAKKWLIIGMIVLIFIIAIRTEVYLRA